MKPGTPHKVLTVEDSVTFGTSYYLPGFYKDTLDTILELHRHGQRLTNSDYPGSHIHLFHVVGYYHLLLQDSGWFSDQSDCATLYEVLETSERGLWSFDGIDLILSQRVNYHQLWSLLPFV